METKNNISVLNWVLTVLILLLMEYGHGAPASTIPKSNPEVLILLLMEYGHGEN